MTNIEKNWYLEKIKNSEYPVKGRGNHSFDSISEDEKFFFGKKL